MVEEYDKDSHLLIMRKLKKPAHFKEAIWTFEVGEAIDKGKEESAQFKANNAVVVISTLANFSSE